MATLHSLASRLHILETRQQQPYRHPHAHDWWRDPVWHEQYWQYLQQQPEYHAQQRANAAAASAPPLREVLRRLMELANANDANAAAEQEGETPDATG